MPVKTAKKSIKKIVKKAPVAEAPLTQGKVYGASPYKPLRSTILVCTCGNKYIKTRPRQTHCLRCFMNVVK